MVRISRVRRRASAGRWIHTSRPHPQHDRERKAKAAEAPIGPLEPEASVDVWPSIDVRDVEARGAPVEERGLSVDPEDLGRQWLNAATDQDNFESSLRPEDDELEAVEQTEE